MSSSTIYNKFRFENLRKFIESLNGTDTLYMGIGRPYYWDVTNSNDNTIPTAVNKISNESADWEDIMSLKRINYSDVSYGIRKVLWRAGYKYDIYRTDYDGTRVSVYDSTYPTSIAEAKCVVVAENYDIYVCIKQKIINGVVQPSLYSPTTGTSLFSGGFVKTADDYVWKKVCVTGTSQYIKFNTTDFFPISRVGTPPAETDPYYDQYLLQEESKNQKAGIFCINVTAVGSGYNGGVAGTHNVTNAVTDAQFKVLGNGTGLQLTVTYGTLGTIVDVEVTNPGSGYTYATVVAATGTGASFDIVFSTPTGLGVNPPKDLDSIYLVMSTTLTGNEGGDFTIFNDYRKINVISNPYNYGTTTISTAPTLSNMTTLTLTGVAGGAEAFGVDGTVTGSVSGTKGKTVDWDSDLDVIRIIKTRNDGYTNYQNAQKPFEIGDVITSTIGAGSGTVSIITPPEVQAYTGNVLYAENRVPIQRSDSSEEVIRTVIQF